ncbi:hypothetical protein SESBI_39859 [Sesbania bispinosa]|nr:hypothetical protein SESBI_39859 [Sesbania bispinosa]
MKKATPSPTTTPSQVAAETTVGDNNDQVNPTPSQATDILAKEDLHGDWIMIIKKKKENKFRGKEVKFNGIESIEGKANHGVAGIKPHYKPLMQVLAKGEIINAQPTKHVVPQKDAGKGTSEENLSTSTTQAQVKDFQGGILTLMEVEYVGPNRLRFVDEPKPPDPEKDQLIAIVSMEEGHINDCEEDQEMVADTYANHKDS